MKTGYDSKRKRGDRCSPDADLKATKKFQVVASSIVTLFAPPIRISSQVRDYNQTVRDAENGQDKEFISLLPVRPVNPHAMQVATRNIKHTGPADYLHSIKPLVVQMAYGVNSIVITLPEIFFSAALNLSSLGFKNNYIFFGINIYLEKYGGEFELEGKYPHLVCSVNQEVAGCYTKSMVDSALTRGITKIYLPEHSAEFLLAKQWASFVVLLRFLCSDYLNGRVTLMDYIECTEFKYKDLNKVARVAAGVNSEVGRLMGSLYIEEPDVPEFRL